jgi:nitroreductase
LRDEIAAIDLVRLLGISSPNITKERGHEIERPDCLLAIFTDGKMRQLSLSSESLSNLEIKRLSGGPNALGPSYVDWQAIEDIHSATLKPHTALKSFASLRSIASDESRQVAAQRDLPSKDVCRVLRTRRSAQAMDSMAIMSKEKFCNILMATLPEKIPSSILPWKAHVNLVLFVHRVMEMERGLYIFLRDIEQISSLVKDLNADFIWKKPAHCPEDLHLYLLAEGDSGIAARMTSCNQDIASDGCFAAAMIAEFMQPLQGNGPWFYSRLHWECGAVGQAMYLSAEVEGFNACGIGCFFDDVLHQMFGLKGWQIQDLYHFTVGKALKDPRLIDLPAYD